MMSGDDDDNNHDNHICNNCDWNDECDCDVNENVRNE